MSEEFNNMTWEDQKYFLEGIAVQLDAMGKKGQSGLLRSVILNLADQLDSQTSPYEPELSAFREKVGGMEWEPIDPRIEAKDAKRDGTWYIIVTPDLVPYAVSWMDFNKPGVSPGWHDSYGMPWELDDDSFLTELTIFNDPNFEAIRKAVDNGALEGSVEVTTKEFSEYANSLPPPTYSPPQSQETQEEGA